MLTLPNLLSCARLLLVPVLLALAWSGNSRPFFYCLIVSLFTDMADGFLARRLNCTTELGAKLDSRADFATYLALPFCAWWLRPGVIRQEALFLGVGIFFYLAAVGFGFVKYRRLTSYHCWSSKVIALLMGAAVLALFAGGPGWPLRLVVPVVALSSLEEIAITTVLSEWRANVPSFRHALQIKRELARTTPR